ncbi:MAG: hypothetical protein DI603_17195 [Roseateles depolymerans]|uniref:Phosphoesterase n=1 Tax=Roseateles depolymerans TaxID=76731 RepID=A0A2W5FEG1_9BURK|nr:MAG: hypothetical protein DI603_17195 [Roseateles depolymerans]
MKLPLSKSQIALAVAALGSAVIVAPNIATAAGKTAGKYVAGDFHNHTTCSDGSISMQKLVKKVTDKVDTPWGLDWFVQAGHGGNGNRNCTLVEDATLATPAYPYLTGNTPYNTGTTSSPSQYAGPSTTWTQSIGAANLKGLNGGVGGNGNMWRWQSIQEYQYPLLEYLSAQKNLPLFIGMESVVAGHEHTSMSIITGQMPASLDNASLPTTPGYTALGNANALAQWSYCFDRGDTDNSRGNTTGSNIGNNWDCSNPASADSTSATLGWSDAAKKLMQPSGTGTGSKGHLKTVEALKWMAQFHGNASYYVPAHLERAGPFNPDGNNGFNIEHLRNFNNAAPAIAFGFESQPGHGAANNRGEYQVKRNNIAGVMTDSVGGTTYGGTGVYAGQVGGVWDALLGEGRNWWFFASSDWHNRGMFGPDDRRSSQDFYPGEYQRTYVMVRNGSDKLRPQTIVDGLRTGNAWSTSGQLIDRLALVVCSSYAGPSARSNAAVEAIAIAAATKGTDVDTAGCATMGEKLTVRPGAELVVAVALRDPEGTNYSPYSFPNPSLAQIGINQPMNKPVLDHVDLIRGMVTGYRQPGTAGYAGEWPRNTDWLRADGSTAGLAAVPAAAKNTSASVIKTFSGNGSTPWVRVASGVDNTPFLKMSFRIPAVQASQYVRLRGSNLPAAVPYETDANGNPLADLFTNANDTTMLRIPCTTAHSANSQFDGCPDHLATASGASPIAGQKAVSYDVAAWADLWFYSNPVYIEVANSYPVAGVR